MFRNNNRNDFQIQFYYRGAICALVSFLSWLAESDKRKEVWSLLSWQPLPGDWLGAHNKWAASPGLASPPTVITDRYLNILSRYLSIIHTSNILAGLLYRQHICLRSFSLLQGWKLWRKNKSIAFKWIDTSVCSWLLCSFKKINNKN